MATIFDGRSYAEKKFGELGKEVAKLKNRGIRPKLASILIGEDPASKLYVSLKKKGAESVGIEMDIYYLKEKESPDDILILINNLNSDSAVHGIMVQLPLPPNFSLGDKEKIINLIKKEKDVDGLRGDSPFIHPTAVAILQAINEAKHQLKIGNKQLSICIKGKGGMVGSALLKAIKKTNYRLIEKPEKADILVSATGSPNIIKKEMVKKGAIVIDVGSPGGDIDPSCNKIASFITPVPGGVGPVTVSCLLENLIVSAGKVC